MFKYFTKNLSQSNHPIVISDRMTSVSHKAWELGTHSYTSARDYLLRNPGSTKEAHMHWLDKRFVPSNFPNFRL